MHFSLGIFVCETGKNIFFLNNCLQNESSNKHNLCILWQGTKLTCKALIQASVLKQQAFDVYLLNAVTVWECRVQRHQE